MRITIVLLSIALGWCFSAAYLTQKPKWTVSVYLQPSGDSASVLLSRDKTNWIQVNLTGKQIQGFEIIP